MASNSRALTPKIGPKKTLANIERALSHVRNKLQELQRALDDVDRTLHKVENGTEGTGSPLIPSSQSPIMSIKQEVDDDQTRSPIKEEVVDDQNQTPIQDGVDTDDADRKELFIKQEERDESVRESFGKKENGNQNSSGSDGNNNSGEEGRSGDVGIGLGISGVVTGLEYDPNGSLHDIEKGEFEISDSTGNYRRAMSLLGNEGDQEHEEGYVDKSPDDEENQEEVDEFEDYDGYV